MWSGEGIAKSNDDFLALVLCYYGALHQYRDKYDLKIKVEGPNWSLKVEGPNWPLYYGYFAFLDQNCIRLKSGPFKSDP